MKWTIVGLVFLAISVIPDDVFGAKEGESAIRQDEETDGDGDAELQRLIGGNAARHESPPEDLESSMVEDVRELGPDGRLTSLEKEALVKGGGFLSHCASRFGKDEEDREERRWDPPVRLLNLVGRDRAINWGGEKDNEVRPLRTHLRSWGEGGGMRSTFKEEGGWGEDAGGSSLLPSNSSDLPSRNLSAWRTVHDPDNKPFNLSRNSGLLGLRKGGGGESARDILWKAMGEPSTAQLERLLVRLIDAKRLEERRPDYEDRGGSLFEGSEEVESDEERKGGEGSSMASRFSKEAGGRRGWLMEALVQKGKDLEGAAEGRGAQSISSDHGEVIDEMMKRLKTDILPFPFGGVLNKLLSMPGKERPDFFLPFAETTEEAGETLDEMLERLGGGNERGLQLSHRTPILCNNLIHRRPAYHHQEHQVSQESERGGEDWGDKEAGEGAKDAEGKDGGDGPARTNLSQKNLAHPEADHGVEVGP